MEVVARARAVCSRTCPVAAASSAEEFVTTAPLPLLLDDEFEPRAPKTIGDDPPLVCTIPGIGIPMFGLPPANLGIGLGGKAAPFGSMPGIGIGTPLTPPLSFAMRSFRDALPVSSPPWSPPPPPSPRGLDRLPWELHPAREMLEIGTPPVLPLSLAIRPFTDCLCAASA